MHCDMSGQKLSWLVFITWINARVIRDEETQLRKYLYQIPKGKSVEHSLN